MSSCKILLKTKAAQRKAELGKGKRLTTWGKSDRVETAPRRLRTTQETLQACHFISLGLPVVICKMQKEVLATGRVLLILIILRLPWKVVLEWNFLESVTGSVIY